MSITRAGELEKQAAGSLLYMCAENTISHMLLTPIIKDAFARKDYGFDIEKGLMLREYLGRQPDSQAKITELLNRNLLSVGANHYVSTLSTG